VAGAWRRRPAAGRVVAAVVAGDPAEGRRQRQGAQERGGGLGTGPPARRQGTATASPDQARVPSIRVTGGGGRTSFDVGGRRRPPPSTRIQRAQVPRTRLGESGQGGRGLGALSGRARGARRWRGLGRGRTGAKRARLGSPAHGPRDQLGIPRVRVSSHGARPGGPSGDAGFVFFSSAARSSGRPLLLERKMTGKRDSGRLAVFGAGPGRPCPAVSACRSCRGPGGNGRVPRSGKARPRRPRTTGPRDLRNLALGAPAQQGGPLWGQGRPEEGRRLAPGSWPRLGRSNHPPQRRSPRY